MSDFAASSSGLPKDDREPTSYASAAKAASTKEEYASSDRVEELPDEEEEEEEESEDDDDESDFRDGQWGDDGVEGEGEQGMEDEIPNPDEDITIALQLKDEGNVHFREKRYEEAIESYSGAIHYCPKGTIPRLPHYYVTLCAAQSSAV
jgi:hypothetical protein